MTRWSSRSTTVRPSFVHHFGGRYLTSAWPRSFISTISVTPSLRTWRLNEAFAIDQGTVLSFSTTGQEVALDEIGRWFVTWGPLPEPNHFTGRRECASMSDAHAYADELRTVGVAGVAVVGVLKQNRAVEDDPVDAIAGKTLRKPAPSTFGFHGSTDEVP